MAEDRNNLRAAFARYVAADDELRVLNRRVATLREHRSIAELEAAEILRLRENLTFNKVSFGNSEIVVKREGQWANPWSLSKSAILRYAESYKGSTTTPTVDGFTAYLEAVYGQSRISNKLVLIRSVDE